MFPGVCQESAYRDRIWKTHLKTQKLLPSPSEAVGIRGVPGQPVWFWASPRKQSPKSPRAICSQSSSHNSKSFFMFKMNSLYFRWCPLPSYPFVGHQESFGVVLHQEFIHMNKIPLGWAVPALPASPVRCSKPIPILGALKNSFVPIFRATSKVVW